jgi:hypothetical protein
MSFDDLREMANWRCFGWLTLLQVVLLTGFWLIARARERHSREPTLDGRNVGYTPDQAFAAVERYGPAGRRLYLIQLATLDLFYPVVYAAWLACAMGIALKGMGLVGWVWLAALIPFAGAAVDYLENVCIITLLLRVPGGARPEGLARLSSSATVNKWRIAYLSLALTLMFAIAGMVVWWLRHR